MDSDTNDGATATPTDPDSRAIVERLIFEQDLNELHLLIDFISGRADRSLKMLAMPNPAKPGETMKAGEIVGAISDMRYPPKGDDAVNAANAAILLMAKDRLSLLAAPARGLTIAYTKMFIDAEVRTIWARLRDWVGRKTDTQGNTLPGAETRNLRPDSRTNLAIRTFPVLQTHARRFRLWRDALSLLSIPCLLLTALAYWDAGLGRTVLERLDQNWKARSEAIHDNPEVAALGCENAKEEDVSKLLIAAKPGLDAGRMAPVCIRLVRLNKMRDREKGELGRVFGCAGMHYSIPLHIWCWHWLLSGNAALPTANASAAGASMVTATEDHSQATTVNADFVERFSIEERRPADVDWQTATAILAVFTTYILPMLFALLGTQIGAFRAILAKIGTSELAPRDFVRMNLGIPTGLVAGLAVGLFLGPSALPIEGAGGISGQLTLTASGLGFLAGYASQSFFGYLDRVIGTVFPSTTSSSSAPPPHSGHS